jgi:pimeloyl-ACP methyl ester carboxylesterase
VESKHYAAGPFTIHARIATDPRASRPVVVLVHGLGMSSLYMEPLARRLAPHFDVYAPDLPGFGLSHKPAATLTVPELADALLAFLDAAGLARCRFIGNSLGCEILVDLALRHPERIDRMVLQGPTPDPHARSIPAKLILFSLTIVFERWSIVQVAVRDYFRCGLRRYMETFRAMIAYEMRERLPHIHAPALVVRGTRDLVITSVAAREVADLLVDGELVIVQGAAHGMNYSHPDALVEAILPFLTSGRRDQGSGSDLANRSE